MRNYYPLINSMGSGAIPSTLNTDLYAVYKAENNANDSLSTYNGSAIGGVIYTTGKSGNSFDLNGTTGYINIGDVMDVGLYSWTYSMWFNANTLSGYQTLFSKTIAAGLEGRIWGLINNNKIEFALQVSSSNIIISTNNTILSNTWYNVIFILDRSDKLKIYLNGALQSTTDLGSINNMNSYPVVNYNTNCPFRIGTYTASDNTTPTSLFSGKIDEFNVWNRVLTGSEITELQTKYYPY